VFRSELKQKLAQIFGLRKTTFDAPSIDTGTGSFEQDTLFIEIDECRSRAGSGTVIAQVIGSIVVFAQMDKLPFGFFNKRIELSGHALTKDFFFFDIDLNQANGPARIQNISERRVRFVYFYSDQFDPDHGELTSLEGI
jgi:hypothetical protein